MNNLVKENKIESMIYEIRGKQVMLDSDLARLYECTNGTKDINKAVKRNIEKFPDDFYFQINIVEYRNLKFQIETLNNYFIFLIFQWFKRFFEKFHPSTTHSILV